jgi:hypothetical protein
VTVTVRAYERDGDGESESEAESEREKERGEGGEDVGSLATRKEGNCMVTHAVSLHEVNR